MKATFFNLIFGVLGSIIVVVPFTGKVSENRYIWYKRLNLRGWIIIATFLATISLTYFKDYQNELDEIRKEVISKRERFMLDSVNSYNEEKSKL